MKPSETRDPSECFRRARDPETSPAELTRLSTSEYAFVREAVARHAATPLAALEAMVPAAPNGEEDFRIAAALLKKPDLPARLCEALAGFATAALPKILPREPHSREFLEALAGHPRSSCGVLASLLDPALAPRHVREWVARKSARADVLGVLARDPSKIVSGVAGRRLKGAP
jgi:hypothetical protein